MEQGIHQEERNQPFALQFLPVIVEAAKTQMLTSIFILVYTSVILSRKSLGEIRCPTELILLTSATDRLLIFAIQQVSLIKSVSLVFKIRVFEMYFLEERLQDGARTLEQASDDLVLIQILPLASYVALDMSLPSLHFSFLSCQMEITASPAL